MKLIKFLIVIFFLLSFNFSNAQNEDLHSKITKNLRCLICQGQSVYDSDSEGLEKKEIYEYLKVKYGEWILYDPEFNKNTYFLWLLPVLMFFIGGAIILKLFIIKKN